jgi:membrane dipeptidase
MPSDSATAQEVHARTLTLDTHVDIPWPAPSDPTTETNRCVDLPKMLRGGMRGTVFIAFAPQGPRTPEHHAESAARVEAMLRALRARWAGGAEGPKRRLATRAADVEAAFAKDELAILLAVENGHAMGRDLARLRLWRDLGAIYVTLTHDGHNDLADSARPKPELGDPPVEHGGLTGLGRDAIAEMNRVGLMLDLSHVGRAAMLEACARSKAPVAVTHTCCRALLDHPRNLDDEQLDAVRSAGGVVQITAVPSFLRAPPPGEKKVTATVADIADHLDHAVRRIGLDHVGISSDFDGGGGVEGWSNAAETPNLTAELLRRGYGPREIGLLWSGNFLRVLRAVERAAAA